MASGIEKRADWKKPFSVGTSIEKLAKHAKKNGKYALRKDLLFKDFNKIFDQELKKAIPGIEDLTPAERAFCEGWLLLARLQCFDETQTDKFDDQMFVQLIKDQLNPPWPHPFTG